MQTIKQSLKEAIANGIVGLIVGTSAWLYIVEPVAHYYNWPIGSLELWQALIINIFFLILHITKTFIIRRFCNSKEGKDG